MFVYASGNHFSELDSRENVLPVKGITMFGKACDDILDMIHLVFTLVDLHSLTNRVMFENELLDHEKASTTHKFGFLQIRISLILVCPFKIPFAKAIRMMVVLQLSSTVALTKNIVHLII